MLSSFSTDVVHENKKFFHVQGNTFPSKDDTRSMQNQTLPDIVEKSCHEILVEDTSLDKLHEQLNKLSHHITLLRADTDYVDSSHLNSRMNLVALLYDVLLIRCHHHNNYRRLERKQQEIDSLSLSSDGTYDEDNFNNDLFTIRWGYEDWERIEKQTNLTKSEILLCIDINSSSVVSRKKLRLESSNNSQNTPENEINEREPLELFEKTYQELVRCFQVQKEIARFRNCLQDLHLQIQMKENSYDSMSFLKQLESAIDDYVNGLKDIFYDADDDTNIAINDENDDFLYDNNNGKKNSGDDLEEIRKKRIPHDLISFLLPELYRRNTTLDKVSDHLLSLLEQKVLLNPKHEFSCKKIHRKFRSLLTLWSNDILGPPATLLQQRRQVPSCSLAFAEKDEVSLRSEDDTAELTTLSCCSLSSSDSFSGTKRKRRD